MATLLFTALGTLIGGPVGGALGALAGRQVDNQLLSRGSAREGPRLTELSITTSSYGMPLARQFGKMRVAGQIIWSTDLVEHSERRGNGKGKPATTQYTYTASFAVALSSRSILNIGRVWADGKLLRGSAGDLKVGGLFRFQNGSGDQPVDPLLGTTEAPGRCPAYRGLAYAVFEDLQLGEFGNRIPALTFEVIADTAALSMATVLDGVVADCDAAVSLTGIEGLSGDGPIIDLLAALDPLFPADCDACAEQLVLRPDRYQIGAVALPEAAISAQREDFGGNAGFSRQRAAGLEQPIAVLRYYDIDRDYQPGAQRAPGQPLPGQPRTIELPAAIGAAAARRLIAQAARRDQWSRQTMSWRVTQLDPDVRPGTIVTVPGFAGNWRIRDWEWRSHGVDLSLVRAAPQTNRPVIADPGRGNNAADLTLAVTGLAACELPWDGNPASPVPLIVAAASSSSPGWSGASLFVDQGDGGLIPLGAAGRARAIIGMAQSALAAASPLLIDRRSSVTIQLLGEDMALQNATTRQLAMGANRALLGGELLQFAAADPLGAGLWRLSGLWRGRSGTEQATETHLAGEAFILLDGTGTILDANLVGAVPKTLIAAIGLADAVPVTTGIALQGIGTRPPAPVHGAAELDSAGNLAVRWVRRARGAWTWLDSVETALNEQAENYSVSFGPLAAPLARWDVTSAGLTIPVGQLGPLRSALPAGPIAIRQRGDRGVSEPLIIFLP